MATPSTFLCPATKSGGLLSIPSELLSVCPSVRPSVRRPSVHQRLIIRVRSITLIPFEIISRNLARRRAQIKDGHSTYIFCGIILLFNFHYRNRVRSITLIPFEIISQNLVEMLSMTRRRAEVNNVTPTNFFFCGIIPLCNFQYRNCVRSITLIPSKIISQILVEI